MFRFSRFVLALSLVLVVGRHAHADARDEAVALAARIVEKHRSAPHRVRFSVQLPEPGAVASVGSARLEARTGRHAIEEVGYALSVEPAGARLTLVSRTHIPVFAARAADRRDAIRLLEASVPIARARVALLALELLAGAHEKPRDGARMDPLDPRLDEPEATSEDPWPRLEVSAGRRSTRRGTFAELARRLLDELGAENGLGDPPDRDAALRRLLPALGGGRDEAARAAFILGDAAFVEALPRLARLDDEEATDAREKIAARWTRDARARLLALSTHGARWDLRRWARERLDPAEWIAALLGTKEAASAAPEDAVVEALGAVLPRDDASGEKVAALLDDPRLLVRAEAAAALLRLTGSPRARDVLAALAAMPKASDDVRETAIARLAATLRPTELGTTLSPIVSDPEAPASVRAQAARSIDESEAVTATAALVQALDGELARSADASRHDLRLALIAALATVATKAATLGAGGDDALRALGRAALGGAEDDVRALAIHAAGALEGPTADKIARSAAELEGRRDPAARRARRAADLELDARSPDAGARLLAIADAVCEAPLRSTLERLARAARDPAARSALVARLRDRGPEGEVGLQFLERH